MILEIATLRIKEGEINDFQKVIPEAKSVISQSKGFVSIEFHQCIEEPSKFQALIKWETLEDHTIGFRTSDLFTQWRAILSPYFSEAPFADHFHLVL
jgi:heme-degrading monooxygenase HmoA